MMGGGIRIARQNGDSWCPLWFLESVSFQWRVLPGETRVLVGETTATSLNSSALPPPPVCGALGVIGHSPVQAQRVAP